MVRFMVLTTQRSGSTFFCTSLASSPHICCEPQAFGRPPSKFRTFIDDKLPAGMAFDHLRPKDRRSLVEQFLDRTFSNIQGAKSMGLRLMYDHIWQTPEILPWMVLYSVHLIHLIRRNRLKTLLSRQIARRTGRYHSKRPLSPVQVRVPCHNLIPKLIQIKTERRQSKRDLSRLYPYMEIFYEDFVAHRKRETARIGNFLGLSLLGCLKSDLVKVNPDSLKGVIQNYDEVADTLNGTPFARFLEEQSA